MIRPIFGLAFISLLLVFATARSTEPLAATELRAMCSTQNGAASGSDASRRDARLCEVYIMGFLDGAIATDGRVAENVAAEIERSESFADRTLRTRGVARRLQTLGETAYADFCVGTPVAIEEVVGQVVDELSEARVQGMTARDAVYSALRRHFSCSGQQE